ncbi:hypothetical protein Tco_0245879 [Tanacetum coccineum]
MLERVRWSSWGDEGYLRPRGNDDGAMSPQEVRNNVSSGGEVMRRINVSSGGKERHSAQEERSNALHRR